MNRLVIVLGVVCCVAIFAAAENALGEEQQITLESLEDMAGSDDSEQSRPKRTLLLKKKILGAGLLGLGIGAVKGYKIANAGGIGGILGRGGGHASAASQPPVRYVEYVENPVYVSRVYGQPGASGSAASVGWNQQSSFGGHAGWGNKPSLNSVQSSYQAPAVHATYQAPALHATYLGSSYHQPSYQTSYQGPSYQQSGPAAVYGPPEYQQNLPVISTYQSSNVAQGVYGHTHSDLCNHEA